jgi:hypothetical protein
MQRIVAWLTHGRVAVFITTFLLTLLVYVLRGIGVLGIVPGWMFLLLFTVTYGLFFLAIHPKRQVW